MDASGDELGARIEPSDDLEQDDASSDTELVKIEAKEGSALKSKNAWDKQKRRRLPEGLEDEANERETDGEQESLLVMPPVLKSTTAAVVRGLSNQLENVDPGSRKMYVRMNLFDIPEIETKTQSFILNFYYEVSWDARVENGRIIQEDREFNPKINFGNMIGNPNMDIPFEAEELNYRGTNKARMCKRRKLTAKFMSQVSLFDFPFDVQDFVVNIRTDLTNKEGYLVLNETLPSMAEVWKFTTSNEYTFAEELFFRCSFKEGAQSSFSNITFRVKGYRKPGFVINNVFVPILFVSSLGLTVFTFHEQDVNEDFEKRFMVNGSLLLTLVAYKFSINNNIPAVNYLTFADKYVLFSIFYQVALVIWSALLVNVVCLGCQDSVDTILFWVFCAIWVAWLVFSVALFYTKLKKYAIRKEGLVQDKVMPSMMNRMCFSFTSFVDYYVPSKSYVETQDDGDLWEHHSLREHKKKEMEKRRESIAEAHKRRNSVVDEEKSSIKGDGDEDKLEQGKENEDDDLEKQIVELQNRDVTSFREYDWDAKNENVVDLDLT